MEKIKEALKRAKNVNTVNTSKKVVNEIDAKINTENQEAKDLAPISYTQTKVIELNNAHLEKNRIVAVNRDNKAAYSLDSLRTQILQKMYENDWKSIAVVSPTEACGKTFLSINLAISIANQPNKTVMLVDCDLRRPKVAKYLGIQVEKSMTEFFNKEAEINDVMINLGIPRLVVLPTMKPVINSAEILSSERTDDFMSEIYSRYDSRIVMYDLPPILNTDDSLVMMRKVDCVLLVVGSGLVKENEVEQAMHHIPKEKLLGVVLNKAENVTDSYYY